MFKVYGFLLCCTISRLFAQSDTSEYLLPEAVLLESEHRHEGFEPLKKLTSIVQEIEVKTTLIQAFVVPNISQSLQQITGVSVHNHGNEGMHISFPASPLSFGQFLWNQHLVFSTRNNIKSSAQNLQLWDPAMISEVKLPYYEQSSSSLGPELLKFTSIQPDHFLTPSIQINSGINLPFYLPNSGVKAFFPIHTNQLSQVLGISFSSRNNRAQSVDYAYSPNLSNAIARELYSETKIKRELINVFHALKMSKNDHDFHLTHQFGIRRAFNTDRSARFLYQSDQGEVVNLRQYQYLDQSMRYQAVLSWEYSNSKFFSETSFSTQYELIRIGGNTPDKSLQAVIYSRVEFLDSKFLDEQGEVTNDPDEAVSRGKYWQTDLMDGAKQSEFPQYQTLQESWFFESARSEKYEHIQSVPIQLFSEQQWKLNSKISIQVNQRAYVKSGSFQQSYQQFLTPASESLEFDLQKTSIISGSPQTDYKFNFPDFYHQKNIIENTERFPFSQTSPFYRQYRALNFSYQDLYYNASAHTNLQLAERHHLLLGINLSSISSSITSDTLIQNPINSPSLYTEKKRTKNLSTVKFSPSLYYLFKISDHQNFLISYQENIELPDYLDRSPGDAFIDYQNLYIKSSSQDLNPILWKNIHLNYSASYQFLEWLELGIRAKFVSNYILNNQFYGNGTNGRLGYLIEAPEQVSRTAILSPYLSGKLKYSDISELHLFEHLSSSFSVQYNYSEINETSFREGKTIVPELIPMMAQFSTNYEGEKWHFDIGIHWQSEYLHSLSYNVNDPQLEEFSNEIEQGKYDVFVESRCWLEFGIGYHLSSKWSVQSNYNSIIGREKAYIGNPNRPYYLREFPSTVSLSLRYGIFN